METIIYIILGIAYLALFVFIAYTVYAMVKGAPFVPTALGNVKKMIKIAELNQYQILIDLGSGDGRILREAAPQVRSAVGIEINPLLYWWSKQRLRKYKNVSVVREDLWKTNIAGADVLTIFFIHPKMEALKKKIKQEMQPGSKVVSYGFRFPDWPYLKKDGKVYLYIV